MLMETFDHKNGWKTMAGDKYADLTSPPPVPFFDFFAGSALARNHFEVRTTVMIAKTLNSEDSVS